MGWIGGREVGGHRRQAPCSVQELDIGDLSQSSLGWSRQWQDRLDAELNCTLDLEAVRCGTSSTFCQAFPGDGCKTRQ